MKKFNYRKLILYIPLCILALIGTYTFSKYIIEEFHSYFLSAKNFYFTSNRLKKGNEVYIINNWSGVGAFDISFTLSSEKNSLVYSNYDIPYTVTVTCPNDVVCTSDKPSGGTIYSSSTTHSDTVVVSVSPTRSYGENESLVVSITAASTSPYEETISADFEYKVGKQGVSYEIEDEPNRTYLLLKITNAINYCIATEDFGDFHTGQEISSEVYRTLSPADKAKCIGKTINLTFSPNVLLLDTTDDILKIATTDTQTIGGVPYIDELEFNIEPVSTMAIKFYKKTTSNNYTYPITNPTSVITVTIT